MADLSPSPDSNGDDTRVRLDHGSAPGTLRWVKIFGIIALILILLFVIQHLTGNSLGGPGGHTPP